MSRVASAFQTRRKATRLPSVPADSTIVEDLRSFARDLGVHGFSAMSKDELVETLRQRYVLEQIRTAGGH